MKRLLDLVIERPIATCMLLTCLTVLGVIAIFRMPLDFLPLEPEPEVDIEVPFSGSHPLETLREIAIPIEEEVAAIPDVRRIGTRASSGQARVEVNFNRGVNIEVKRMEVREAVERARGQLPEGIGFIRVEGEISGPADGAMLQGRISAERDLSESWELLDRRVKRPIERIKGVASVSLNGVERQEVRVELDFAALEAHGLIANDVLAVINAANLDMDLGAVRGDVVRYNVRTVARFQELDEIRDLALRDGLRVRDVATVEAREPDVTYGRHLDRSFAIGIDVFKEPSANTVQTVDAVLAKIEEIEEDPALEGIQLLVWENAGEQIRHALAGLRDAGIYGGLLAVGVLYFFLRRVRNTLIVAIAIPFSLVVTCGGMLALGSEFNVLTLLGLMLGVGMLVDNAVVVMENIHRLQEGGMAPREAAKVGARDVAMAVTASTATTLIVWSWLLTAEESEMVLRMRECALTICLSVVCSLLVSLTFIPLAAARLAQEQERPPGFLVRRVAPGYRALLGWTLRHRFLALLGLIGLAATSAYPLEELEITGDTNDQEYNVEIRFDVHDPATKEVLEGHINKVEAWLDERKQELDYDSMYSWYSEGRGVMIRLYLPRDEATPEKLDALREKLRGNLPAIPGVRLKVGNSEFNWRRPGSDGRRLVSIAVTGEDPEYLEELALDVERRVVEIPEVIDIWGPGSQGQKELRIRVDAERAKAVGVSPRSVAETVGFAFRGRRLRRFQTDTGELDMVVGLPEDLEQGGLRVLSDLPIPVALEGTAESSVPLSSLARFEIARMPPEIRRTDRETTRDVRVEFDKEVKTEDAQALVAARLADFTLPDGYRWSFGEWGQRRDETLGTMLSGTLISLAVVLLLMAALFESLT